MKKLTAFLLVCLFVLPCVYADNDEGGLRIKDRTIEVGLNAKVGFTNDLLSVNDFFQKTVVLDLDKLKNGIRINLDADVFPLYFNFNHKNNWGFGLSINADVYGILGLSGKLLSFSEAVESKSDISAAVFADAGLPVFFHIKQLKVKLRPAVYLPVVYAVSDVSYTFSPKGDGTELYLTYDINVFSAFSMEKFNGLTASPGADFQLGFEFPLSRALGLKDKFFMLDFDIGVNVINIPLMPASMSDYMKISGSFGSEEPIVFNKDSSDMEDLFQFNSNDAVYSTKEQKVRRPFKMYAWADWRPFGVRLLTITPEVGFAINPLYNKAFSMEAGVKTRLDIANLFMATLGIGYYDRFWKNSLDLALNLRAFELDIGADLRSQSFLKSWTGSGFGVNLGLKFGW